MRLRLLCVGQKMPAWVNEGFVEYARRFPPEMKLQLDEIPLATRGRNPDLARAVHQEGQRMLSRLSGPERVIALDERGQGWTTRALSGKLESWRAAGGDVAFLVGGPDGLDKACLERAESRWSLSPLTLPHPLVRILVAEQLYRAWSITRNHPYHRV